MNEKNKSNNTIKNILFEKKFHIKYEKQILCLITAIILRLGMTYLYDLTEYIPDMLRTRIANVLIAIVIVLPAFVIYKKWGAYHEPKIDWKNYRQYLYGIILSVPLFAIQYLVLHISSMDNNLKDALRLFRVSAPMVIYCFFYYFFIVALFEEFVYRVYYQGELTILLGRMKWLAPFFSAVIFGFGHIIQGTIPQVYMTFFIGLVLGYAKYFCKNCTVVSLVIAHGLFDFCSIVFGI
ncbi:MAG: lysostaphin resistance A-like protein [Wujia sp.]